MSTEHVWMLHPEWAAKLSSPEIAHELAAVTPGGPRDKIARRYEKQGMLDFSPDVTIDEGVAVVRVDGTLTRRPEFWQAFYDGISSEMLANKIEELAVDDSVDAIVLRIDSPGGEASGLPEVADAVYEAAKIKPVVSVADRMAASGAYYIASQSTKLYAGGKDADVGSIGTLLVAYDYSQMFANAGIKPLVFRTGPYKGTGTPGLEFTEEQQAYLQARVDETQKHFVEAVKRGRGLTGDQLAAAADGRVFRPAEAARLGLIDGVKSFADVLAEVKSQFVSGRKRQKGNAMSNETPKLGPADFASLKSCIPGATAEFIVEALGNAWTLDQAQSTWMERQAKRIVDLEKQAADAEGRAKVAQAPASGVAAEEVVEPGKATSDTFENPVQSWFEKVTECAKECGGDRIRGFRMATRRYPDLQKAAKEAGNR